MCHNIVQQILFNEDVAYVCVFQVLGLSVDLTPGWNLSKVDFTGDSLQSLRRNSLHCRTQPWHLDRWNFPVYCSTSLMILIPTRHSKVSIHLYSQDFYFKELMVFGNCRINISLAFPFNPCSFVAERVGLQFSRKPIIGLGEARWGTRCFPWAVLYKVNTVFFSFL